MIRSWLRESIGRETLAMPDDPRPRFWWRWWGRARTRAEDINLVPEHTSFYIGNVLAEYEVLE